MLPLTPAALAAAETLEHDITLAPDTGAFTATGGGAGAAEIEIFGIVGLDFTARDVRRALTTVQGRDLMIRINSQGGIVTEGFAIFNALARHKGRKTVTVEGQACSIAAFIAMAADEIVMPRASLMMIHNSSGGAFGNAETMAAVIEVLGKIDGIQADIIAARTGQALDHVKGWLSAETYFTAAEAIEAKLADTIEERAAVNPTALASLQDVMARAGGQPVAIRMPPSAAAPVVTPPAQPVNPVEDRMSGTNIPPAGGQPPQAVVPPITPPAITITPPAEPVATAADLQGMVARSGGALDASWALTQLAANATVAAAREALIDAMAARQPQRPNGGIQITRDERDTFRASLEEAVLYKMGAGPETDRARPFLGRTAIELARACVETAGGKGSKFGADNLRLAAAAMNLSSEFRAEAGMHTTSDFPLVLGNAAKRILLNSYSAVPQNWKKITQVENFDDFRKKQFLKLSASGQLERVGEHGEFKYGTLVEGAEGFAIDTWGKIFAFTRQALINDDLGALARAMRERGGSAAKTVSRRVWGLVINGHVGTGASKVIMSDGKAVFHADHGNLAGTGTAITDAAVTAAYLAFATQTDTNGDPIDVLPKYLVVGPAKAAEAKKFLGTTRDANGVPNIYQGDLELIVEPRITGNAWYIFAEPPLTDGLAVGFLNGRQEPRLDEKAGWNIEGVEFKVALDFEAGWLDYRVAYRNPGN